MLPDDSSLTDAQYRKVRQEAERALNKAGVRGVFPTPIDAIMQVAEVQEVKEDVLNPSFIDHLREKAGLVTGALKKAVSKVLGIFHAPSGLIFIDRRMLKVKQRFVGFHEAGHGFMPWQRAMYSHVEDGDNELSPDAADLFDREANVFATEVLFQLDALEERTKDCNFSIYTPVDVADEFGASKYATIRQYVSKSQKNCAVIVLNKPVTKLGSGYCASLRRSVISPSFKQIFGDVRWPDEFTADDPIGAMIPLARNRSSGQRSMTLVDLNGETHELIAESFTNTYQVFVLIHSVRTLSTSRIIMPAA